MKTTLKRGYGRGAALNGNGHRNGAAVAPPRATPVVRYRQPEPPRRSGLALVRRILVGTLLLLVLAGAGAAGGAYLYYHESVASVRAHTPDVKRAAKQLDIPLANHAAIALVVGYDHRLGKESEGPSRSDTMMLVRADPLTKTISLLSFPRDLLVPLYCPDKDGNLVGKGTGKINSAYAICGSQGSLATVKQLIGLPVNYLITVDFRGFRQVVDRLGGVWMDVDRRYYNKNTGSYLNNFANINLQPGYQKLSGQQALDFVRFRHTDDDLHRVARQQAFVRSFREQVSTSFSPFKVPSLVNAITSNIEVADGGRKLQGKQVYNYALFAYGLPAGHVFQDKIENVVCGLGCTAAPEEIQKAVQSFSNPDVESSKTANAAALGRKIKQKAPPVSTVSVTVLNGSGVAGVAADTSYLLGQRGYRVVTPPNNLEPNAPRQDYFHTVIYYNSKPKTARAAAAGLAKLFGDAETQPITRQLRRSANGAMLVVVLGQTYHGRIGPAPVDRTPRRQPANVQTNPGATVDLLRPLQRQMRFRLMVPHVLERTSLPAHDVPARAYRIAGHPSVRLTFATGASEYWGIQMVAWNDAPALRGANEVLRIKGRRYDLYYSGARLHMVVLHGPKASYWVVNTIVNSLSNETMLAVAKGLKPLGSG